jgi:hypothetical protein
MPKSSKKRKNGAVKSGSAQKEGIAPKKLSHGNRIEQTAAGLQALAQDFERLVKGVESAFTQQGQNFNNGIQNLSEVLGAVIEVLDIKEKTTELMKAKRLAKDAADEQEKKGALAELLEKGIYVPSTEIKQDSIIVGVEKDKEGVVLPPGRRQLNIGGMKPEFQKELVGKSLGATLKPDGENGKTLYVTEIYSIDHEKLAEEQKKASEAAEKAQAEHDAKQKVPEYELATLPQTETQPTV